MAAIPGTPHPLQIPHLVFPDREVVEFRDLLDRTVQELGLGEENWNSKAWSKLVSGIPQSYLDSVFQHQVEVIRLFGLEPPPALDMGWINEVIDMDPRLSRMPREDALHTLMRIFPKYYQSIAQDRPKDLSELQEQYTKRLSGLPYGWDPLYFTVLADTLSFHIFLKSIHELPELIEHLRCAALKQEGGKICVRDKNQWDQPDTTLRKFIHVYLPQYGLIEFKVLINRTMNQAALFP